MKKGQIIFTGDSQVEFGNWTELFPKHNIVNRGISGDIIAGLFARIRPILESEPKKIFIEIGTNDPGKGKSPEQIVSGYTRLLNHIRKQSPGSAVFVFSLFPTLNDRKRPNKLIIKINQALDEYCSKNERCNYINLFDALKSDKNELNSMYTEDGLHLNGEGYRIWQSIAAPYLAGE